MELKHFCLLIILNFSFNLFAQNVGVNNPNPDRSLDILGTTQIERSSSSTNPQLDLRDVGDGFSRLRFSRDTAISDKYWILAGRTFQNNDPSSAFNLFYEGDTVSGNLLTVRGSGRTGINVSNPSDRFHINSKAGEDAFRVQIDNQTKFRIIANGGVSVGVNNPAAVPANGMYVAGNVGLGIQNPTDKLGVSGNMHITGEIRPDGNSGNAGQMLMSDGQGGMNWSAPCAYNSFKDFHYTGAIANWQVPVEVDVIKIEAWGGGGGGALGGAGGSGAYICALVDVVAGEIFDLYVGIGGVGVSNGQNINGAGGITTDIIGSGVVLNAGGGSGASTTSWGNGGVTGITPTTTLQMTRKGNNGEPNTIVPVYSGYTKTVLGKGGCAFLGGDGGKGEIHNGSGGGIVYNEGTPGIVPAGGGGGGNQFGNEGANGYIIISWNQ